MKSILLIGALFTIVAFSSCSTSHYVSRPASSHKYYGRTKHQGDHSQGYNNGHSRNKKHHVSTGHSRW